MNVDGIFVISLDSSDDRRKKMLEWYPPNVLNFYLVKRMKNPEQGCYNSHQKIMMEAKQKGLNRILILEDDAYPLKSWNTIVQQTNQALLYLNTHNPKWRSLMLGYLPIRSHRIKNNPNVIGIKCAYDAHAYIVNLKYFKHIPYKGIQIDTFLFCNTRKIDDLFELKRNTFGVYGVNPMLFTQRTDHSTIDSGHLIQEAYIKLYGDEQKMIEFSLNAHTITTPVFIIFFIVFLFLVLLAYYLKLRIFFIVSFSILMCTVLLFIIILCIA